MTATLHLLGFWFLGFFYLLTFIPGYVSNIGPMLWHLNILIKLAFVNIFFFGGNSPEKGAVGEPRDAKDW